jgi:hypothetical protein
MTTTDMKLVERIIIFVIGCAVLTFVGFVFYCVYLALTMEG